MFDNKCRAKNTNGQWVVGYHVFDKQHYLLQDLKMIVRGAPELVNLISIDDTTLGRSMHHTDKDGKTIYEGDIASWFNTENLRYIVRFGRYANSVGFGYYSGSGFYLELIGDYKHTVPIDEFRSQELRVVGNIYDNLEMLKKVE